jgi:hypothetical protein
VKLRGFAQAMDNLNLHAAALADASPAGQHAAADASDSSCATYAKQSMAARAVQQQTRACTPQQLLKLELLQILVDMRKANQKPSVSDLGGHGVHLDDEPLMLRQQHSSSCAATAVHLIADTVSTRVLFRHALDAQLLKDAPRFDVVRLALHL